MIRDSKIGISKSILLVHFAGVGNLGQVLTRARDPSREVWYPLGCPKNALSSQTEKFIRATAFSHYLGLKHIRTTKILKIYAFFHPNQAVQSFTT